MNDQADTGEVSPQAGAASDNARLERVVLDGLSLGRLSPIQEADRAQAIADLQAENHFQPIAAKFQATGPFVLHLSVQDGRLVFDIRTRDDKPVAALGLAMGPFRGLVKDYHMLVDSHIKAVEEGREARIHAIDMGRRGLHDEGAKLMTERLAGRVSIDFETARRLFTLVCILHQRA